MMQLLTLLCTVLTNATVIYKLLFSLIPPPGFSAFCRELQSVKTKQEEAVQDDGGVQRTVLIYSKEFFQMMSKSNPGDAKRVAGLLLLFVAFVCFIFL